jgi:hypothetical protein
MRAVRYGTEPSRATGLAGIQAVVAKSGIAAPADVMAESCGDAAASADAVAD